MPTAVTCPNPDCARRSTVPDGVAGRSVRCPACGTRFPAGSGTTVGASGPATPSRTDLAAVGRFVVREKLGAGAFGTVYRAYDPHLDREVALKVPNPGVLDGPTRVERFLREAKAAANLRHPHVVPVYDAGRDGDRYFIASAFVDGKPLSEAVEDGGVDVNRAARLTRELAEALAYAHGEGIVHRDVKPANVMLDAADRVHLMDFGLASRADEASRLTTDGAVLGTPAYMAPENATGAAGDPQPAADQYACGVVLYELLTGRVPFEGPVHVVLHNQVHADPEPPSAGRRAVSKDLETICLKALAKRPERRYRDCQALADDLRRWQEGEPIAARRMGVVERARRWAQKEPKLAVAGAVVALVVLVSVAVVSGAARRAIRAAGEAEEARAGAEEARTGAVTEAARARTAEKQAADALAAEKVARARELKATGEVVAAKQRTEQEQGKVAAEQVKTEQERKNAEREKARTEAIRGAVRRAALGARITQTAHEEAVAGRAGLAESILDLVSPEDRSFEWWHATNVCRTGAASAPEFSRQPTGVRAASFNPAGTRVVTTGGEFTKSGEARVWDAKTGALLQTFNGHADIVLSAGFSPDGVWVVTGSSDKTARVWGADTGQEARALNGHSGMVASAGFSADGSRIVTGSSDKTAKVWDAKTGADLLTFRGHTGSVSCASFAPDGTRVVSAGAGPSKAGEAKVWNATTGAELLTLKGHTDFVFAARFSADGSRIATCSRDGTVKLWDARTGAEVLTFKGHTGSVFAMYFTPDGARIVTGGSDRTVKVTNARTGTELLSLKGHGHSVQSIHFNSDGTRLLTADAEGTVRVWEGAPTPEKK